MGVWRVHLISPTSCSCADKRIKTVAWNYFLNSVVCHHCTLRACLLSTALLFLLKQNINKTCMKWCSFGQSALTFLSCLLHIISMIDLVIFKECLSTDSVCLWF